MPGKYHLFIFLWAFRSSELMNVNFSINSALSTRTLTQEYGPDHGVDADLAELDARELTTAFQHALSNNNNNIDEDAMDVDSNANNCEGEDENDENDEEDDAVVLANPRAQSAKEWVCFCTHDM